jgi:hypothetical protein
VECVCIVERLPGLAGGTPSSLFFASLRNGEGLQLLDGQPAGRDFVVFPSVDRAQRYPEPVGELFLSQSQGRSKFSDLYPIHRNTSLKSSKTLIVEMEDVDLASYKYYAKE